MSLPFAVILAMGFVASAEARFLSTDPADTGKVGSSQSWNRYSYVSNNPLNRVDPDGRRDRNLSANEKLQNRMGDGAYQRYVADSSAQTFIAGTAAAAATTTLVAAPELAAAAAPYVQSQVLNGNVNRAGELVGNLASPNPDGLISNPVPSTLARVVPGEGVFPTLGPPGNVDVFVTAADDIAGLNAAGVAEKLAIPESSTFTVIEFPTPPSGVASPVLRSDPGFVGGGLTAGGAREFVIPNGPVPDGAATRRVE